MLDVRDRIVLAPGVSLEGNALVDAARALRVPVNASARLVIEPHGQTLAAAAQALGRAYRLPPARARDDVLAFAWQLNAVLLANVERHASPLRRAFAWLSLAVRLLPSGSLPPVAARRAAVLTPTPLRAMATSICGLAPSALIVGFAVFLAVLQAASVAGLLPIVEAGAIASGVGIGIVLHEAGHAACLGRVPAALAIRPARVSLLHPPLPTLRRQVVATVGPALPAAVGLALLATGALAALPPVALAGLPLAGHAVGLTVLTRDGRNACGT